MPNKKLSPEQRAINLYIGKKVCFYRDQMNVTRRQIAKSLGMCDAATCRIESGKQGVTTLNLLKLCALFKCKYEDLLPPVPKVAIEEKPNTKTLVMKKKNINTVFNWAELKTQ